MIIDEQFEWDAEKAASNVAKHGVSFDEARAAFRDRFALEFIDDRESYGEERLILIGASASGLLFVVYVEVAQRHRIISARRATKLESQAYVEANSRN